MSINLEIACKAFATLLPDVEDRMLMVISPVEYTLNYGCSALPANYEPPMAGDAFGPLLAQLDSLLGERIR